MYILEPVTKLERNLVFSNFGAPDRKAGRWDEIRIWRDGSLGPGSGFISGESSSFSKGKSELFRGNQPRLRKDFQFKQDDSMVVSSGGRMRFSRTKSSFEGEDEKSARWHRGVVEDRLSRGASSERESLAEDTAVSSSDGEDWKKLSRAFIKRQTFSSIPNHDLMKIAELRFSGDMREGDSGDNVSLLQRALYSLGYLPHDTYISGYFGAETKKALQDFQEAYGVHSSGSWGSLSRQALWHNISAEILHRVGDEKVVQRTEPTAMFHQQSSTTAEAGMQIWQTIQQLKPGVIAEAILSSVPKCDRRLSSGWNVGFAVFFGGVLLGLIKVKSSVDGLFRRQSVKRRVLRSQWYDNSGRQTRANRVFQKERSESNKAFAAGKDSASKPFFLQCHPNLLRRKSHDQPDTYGDHVRGKESTLGSGKVPVLQYNQDDPLGQPRHKQKGSTASSLTSREKETEPEIHKGWQASQGQSTRTHGSTAMAGEREKPAILSNNTRVRGSSAGIGKRESSEPGPELLPENTRARGSSAGTGRGERSDILNRNIDVPSNFVVGADDPTTAGSFTEEFPQRRVIISDTPRKGGNDLKKGPFKERDWDQRSLSSGISNAHKKWQEEDELDLRRRIEELRKTVQAAEQNRQVAMRALAEERQRSLELEVKIRRQREAAAALEEEVRVLKESHDALLASLRKKYSSSAAARAAAALLYQNWDSDEDYCAEKLAS